MTTTGTVAIEAAAEANAEATANVTVENILEQYKQLSLRDRQRLVEALTGRYFPPPAEWFKSRVISTKEPYNPRTKEYEWLDQHRYEYIGEWLALEGDRLVAHDPIAKEVFAKVRKLGCQDAYFVYVHDPDMPFVDA
ncbi:MAG: hypothetical protein HYR56_09725 [Acidobacteria bacterium]|nr:hypothetical protein [Acidobacteriota bacterium]MBI3428279.1 hypothetical protein [Acidobacteriota bacterium]